MRRKLSGIINVAFDITGQLLIIYSAFVKYLKKKKWEYDEEVHQLFIDFKKAMIQLEGRSYIRFSFI